VSFDLLPAIDLRAGRVVRLRQGDFAAETVYDSDPVSTAGRFIEAGARWIHVVDLDGARSGTPQQRAIVARIVDAVGERAGCQVAGGLRTLDAVAAALDAGAGRVVVGTAALVDPDFAGSLIAHHGPGRIVVALDVRDGLALGEGWRPGAVGLPVEDALLRLAEVGVERFAVTGVDRDGLLDGPDLDLLRRLVGLDRGAIVASGGVSSLDDLLAVRALGCAGAIVGRALYEGRLDLAAALRLLGD
jgi:phosphoribosylformimino-5-aminoimidazole carboxamide ribotide isomerase